MRPAVTKFAGFAFRHTSMNTLPDIFKKYTTYLWYIFLSATFFFFFVAIYEPFRMRQALDMGRGMFIFNTSMLMCIVLVTLLLTRTLLWLLRKYLCHNWWQYIAWMALEFTALTYFFALYLYFVGGRAIPYFAQLAICLQYTFLIVGFPYFGVTTISLIISLMQQPVEHHDTIRFTDANRQVKIVLLKDAILYVQADENYIKIHYVDNGKVKQYSLRTTMAAISPMMEQFGLFRCHRSYFVNVSHIVALRKDPGDVISAELDMPQMVIPVSRRLYHALSNKMV